ncbi:MAG: hypothetical protein WBE58_10860 [Verrucomicrobiales bacterium]
MKSDHERLELIRQYIDGSATPEAMQSLQDHLRNDPEFRRLFARYASLDSALGDGRLAGVPLARTASPTRQQSSFKWLNWRPIAAATAGIVFGMFCTSVVFAYALPKSPVVVSKALPLADADFESGTQVPAQGIPAHAGAWSGDFSRVVAAENGIKPKHGQRMLRILRSDNELSPKIERSYVGSVAQVIDLRPLRAQLSGAEQLVEVSAQFNSIPTPPGPQYEFAVKAAAFRGDISDAPRIWEDHEASVSRSTRSVVADSDGRTWQPMAVALTVPPDADFLVIECAVVRKGGPSAQGVAEFPGHYVDQVEVRLSGSASWINNQHAN